MKNMAATATTSFPIPAPAPVIATIPATRNRRRRISPQAGRALEKLGHAIEYLTDEFVNRGGSLSATDPDLKAVQLLMALNRQVYFECPVVPTLRERCDSFIRRHIL
jgi:hypothetical protein